MTRIAGRRAGSVAVLLGLVSTVGAGENGVLAFRYGFAPDRVGLAASGWHADNNAIHATDFEDRYDFTRIVTGLEQNFIRAYLYTTDPDGPRLPIDGAKGLDVPGVTKPGRMVLRARRNGASSKIIVNGPAGNVCTYLQQTGSRCTITGGAEPIEWGNRRVWDRWHDYIFDFDGTTWTFCVDADPATRVTLKARKSDRLPYISLGMGYEYGKVHYFDVESLRFEPPGVAYTPPPPSPRLNGPHTATRRDGSKWVECVFRKGVLDGPMTRWHANGRKEAEGRYVAGKRQGAWTGWYPDGRVRIKQTYRQGTLDGRWRRWYPDGQVETDVTYRAGRADGEFRRWFRDGKPEFVGGYKADVMHGHWCKWAPNGHRVWEHQTVDGFKDQYVKTWYWSTTGRLKSHDDYHRGLPHGRHVLYWPDGRQKQTGRYRRGWKVGEWISYDEDGQVRSRQSHPAEPPAPFEQLMGWGGGALDTLMPDIAATGFTDIIVWNQAPAYLRKLVAAARPYGIGVYASLYLGDVKDWKKRRGQQPPPLQEMTDAETRAAERIAAELKTGHSHFQGGGEPAGDRLEVLTSELLCFHHPEVMAFFKEQVRDILAVEGVTGIAFDYFGYRNYRCCRCEQSRRLLAEYRAKHPELSAEAASERFSLQTLAAAYNELADFARATRPGARTTAHVYPVFLPEPLYGHRLDLDYPAQTVAWFFKPLWPIEKVRDYSRRIVGPAGTQLPRNQAMPFVGIYIRPGKVPVRDPQRITAELQAIRDAGADRVQVHSMVEVVKDLPTRMVFQRFFRPVRRQTATAPAAD